MDYDQTLAKLAGDLREQAMTARQIAAACGCSMPVAYARVRALRDRGITVLETRSEVAAGKRGPKPVAYRVAI